MLVKRMGLSCGASVLIAAIVFFGGCSSSDPTSGVPTGSSSGGSTTSGGSTSGGSSGGSSGNHDSGTTHEGGTTTTASATLNPLDDAGTTGTATFTESNGQVTVEVSVTNAIPGTHGLHVHQGTDCTSPGPHYGPDGGPYHGEFKITVGGGGTGTLTVSTGDIQVASGAFPVAGHALVYHALAPSDGGAAPRQACGVIH